MEAKTGKWISLEREEKKRYYLLRLEIFLDAVRGRARERRGAEKPSDRRGNSQERDTGTRSPTCGPSAHVSLDPSELLAIKGFWQEPPCLWTRLQGHSLKLGDMSIEWASKVHK